MTDHETYARGFIAAQTLRFQELNVNGMTHKQRRRIKALDVISAERRAHGCNMAANLPRDLGWPPDGDTGRMRVVNMETGEVQLRRAPARKLDFAPVEEIAEVVL
jgi:hypothetical protein